MIVPEVWLESKSARNGLLDDFNHDQALSTLNKAKALIMAVWQDTGAATSAQIAEYYEVTPETVRQVCQRHRDELEADGLKVLRGEELKLASDIMSLATKTTQLTIWTPRAALRLGMLLRDSDVAHMLRTVLLELVDAQTTIRRRKPPRKPSRQQAKQIVNLDAKKQLEAIKMGVALLKELGGMDEQTRLSINHRIRNIILEPHQNLPSPDIPVDEAVAVVQKFGDCLKEMESLGLVGNWNLKAVTDRMGRRWVALWYKDVWESLERLGKAPYSIKTFRSVLVMVGGSDKSSQKFSVGPGQSEQITRKCWLIPPMILLGDFQSAQLKSLDPPT